MDSSAYLSTCKEVFNCSTAVFIDSNSAHVVVCCRSHLHRFGFNIYSCIFKLDNHGFKFFIDVVRIEVGYCQIYSSMFASTAFLDFVVYGPGYNITACKLHPIIIIAHEALSFAVYEPSTFCSHSFGYKHSFFGFGMNHSSRVELYFFHVKKFSSGSVSKREAISVFLGGI